MILYRREKTDYPLCRWRDTTAVSDCPEGIFTCASAEKGRGSHRTEKPQILPGLDAGNNDDRGNGGKLENKMNMLSSYWSMVVF